MGKRDKRIDAYVAKSAPFAQPVLEHFRSLVHAACPGVEETIKWGFPHFDYHGIMCSMAAFKQHCSIGFWKASLLADPNKKLTRGSEAGMGDFGKLVRLSDLPSDKVLVQFIKAAARLNEEGVKVKRRRAPAARKPLVIPAYFKKALQSNTLARQTFDNFSYSHKKDYLEWITEAKTEETRSKRIATTVQWLSEGKSRNWKYAQK